jgi:bifunctional DNA-binding transcriptional regulator/antitoxin component of YhaV-PrlF toxin-antitoxin module
MSVSILSSKNRICLPAEIVKAAQLRQNDEIAWTVDQAGQILGRKLSPAPAAAGKLVRDAKTGLLYWAGKITAEEAEWAALNANLPRDD